MKKKSEHADKTIRHRSTFAILFYINRTKMRKDGTCQLLCKVSIDAEWEQIGTKVSVNPDIWNPEKGLANGRSANAVTVNRAIDELTEEITGHYNRIKNSLGFITAELVKNAVMGVGLKPLTLLALFREHNEDFRRRVGLDRIKETLDSYLRSYKHLSAFIKDKKGVEDVTLRSLDKNFYDDFELFLCKDCHMMPKTVHEHLYRLKKMTKLAVSQGTLRRDPYCRLHPALPRRKSRHMKLEDLKKLMETPVEPVAVLAAVPYRVAVVAGRNIVPVPAAVVAVATLSAVAEDWLPVSAVRQEPEPPSVSVPAVAEDTVEPAAVVGLVRLPVVPAAVVAAEPVLPSVQTDCPCSSPLSVPPPSRQSSSGPAVWRKDVPVRVR